MQIPGAAIVAEALPRVENVIFRGRRQTLEGWETFEPAFIEWHYGGNLRLLKHDFRNHNRVRIIGAAPGQIASVGGIPPQKASAKLCEIIPGHGRKLQCAIVNVQHSMKAAQANRSRLPTPATI